MIETEIERLKKEAAAQIAEGERLAKLAILFPDLQKCTDRWKNVVYGAQSANTRVTDYDWKYSCGCCNDAALVIRPYLMTEYGKVYSYPDMFYVGRKSYWSGTKLYHDWREKITGPPERPSGIPEAIIENISSTWPVAEPLKEGETDW